MSLRSLILHVLWVACLLSCSESRRGASAEDATKDFSMRKDSFRLPEEASSYIERNDVVFDDFFYNFVLDREFRAECIVFPLPVTRFGQMTTLKRKDWKDIASLEDCTIYAMLFSSGADVGAEKDTMITDVEVDIVHLKGDSIQQLFFERKDERWQLSAMRTMRMMAHANRSFFAFYSDFANDTVFQQEHVKNPFYFKTEDEYSNETIEGVVNAEAWAEYCPELPGDVLVCINYGKTILASSERYFVLSNLSAGLSTTLRFRQTRAGWKLTHLENY